MHIGMLKSIKLTYKENHMVRKKATFITAVGIIVLSTQLVGCSHNEAKNNSEVKKIEQNKKKEDTSSFNFIANKKQPETVKDFIPLFAQQLKKYNQVAEKIWPNNAITQIPVVLEDTDSKAMWKITPDGQISDFSEKEAKEMNVDRSETPGTWGYYGKQFGKFGVDSSYNVQGKNLKGGGMYFSLNAAALKDKKTWNSRPHLGSYDALVFALHENFHIFEQDKWDKLSNEQITELGTKKDQHLEDVDARLIRHQLIKELMAAIEHPKDKNFVLQALATYNQYKEKNKTDFDRAQYWDRTEGTAHYLELMTSIYTYFPEQLKTDEDINKAIQSLGKQTQSYTKSAGTVDESYDVGAMASFLLDRYDSSWKNKLMKDKNTTPISLLADYFRKEKLPAYEPLNQDDKAKVLKQISDKKKELVGYQKESLVQLKKELQGAEDATQKEMLEKEIAALEKKIAALEK